LDFSASSVKFGVQGEYVIGIWKPFISVEGSMVTPDESRLKGDSYKRAESQIGLEIGKTKNNFSYYAKGYCALMLINDVPEYTLNNMETANTYDIKGDKEDGFVLGLGLGLEYEISKAIGVFIDATIEVKDSMGYNTSVGGKYKF
ncbi:MAG: hypothetical protein LBT79_07625, partial [Elusimicrobiota bacterium]|nr:hypothetical protein [Elusimicrobiota bacterium]